MPKISAPTVGAHREAQRASLVRAAEAVLQDEGMAGINPRTVTERAGMSRSSFYDYFPSRDDLLIAVAIEAFDRWNHALAEALEDVPPGLPRLRALIDSTMRMTADGEHDLAGHFRQAEFSPSRFDDLMVLHDALLRPVAEVLADLGTPDRFVALVHGALGAGVQAVQHGADPATTAQDVFALLESGLPRR
ncbi:TetR/AcrR family transcriptional regulator [Aeromicrobium sp.]|uniref:TetR/AcrR family transcriptional regulator n=1 Tax=Aeromicrobium sp. TaxID=1871063 RepID=UPI0028B18ADF|nr:TetR/AcrR family transcriptional regulator [Aeromicrobium sp.]